MTINVNYKLYEVAVLPAHGEHQNVVARVSWGVEYEQQGFLSHHSEMALLPVDNIQSFIPIDQLSKEQIIAWCIELKGGDEYLNGLLGSHQHLLAEKIAQKDIEVYEAFPVDPLPFAVVPPMTIPQEIL